MQKHCDEAMRPQVGEQATWTREALRSRGAQNLTRVLNKKRKQEPSKPREPHTSRHGVKREVIARTGIRDWASILRDSAY